MNQNHVRKSKASAEVHAILAYIDQAFDQATGGWRSRARAVRKMLVAHLHTLEYPERDRPFEPLQELLSDKDKVKRVTDFLI